MYRVYEYGQSTLREKIDETAVVEQIYRHKLWNTLLALDRAFRARTRELLRDELQDEIDALPAHIGHIRCLSLCRRLQQRQRRRCFTHLDTNRPRFSSRRNIHLL